MNFECKVIDDFIPLSWQEDIKRMLFANTFPWYYSSDVTYGDNALNSQASPAFSHGFRFQSTTLSNYFNFIAPMAHIAGKEAGVDIHDITNCRSFMQLPLTESMRKKLDPLHVDQLGPHLVVLYYVLDADGDTIIVDKMMLENRADMHLEAKDYKELWRVTPKQGRAVLFDGRYYHTAEQPEKNIRCIINMDVTYKEKTA